MPKAYIVARIDVTDPERYARYVAVTPGVVARFGGRFLARGGRYDAKEGPARARNVIIEFPDYDTAQRFYDDAEYRTVLQDGIEGSDRELVIVEGAN